MTAGTVLMIMLGMLVLLAPRLALALILLALPFVFLAFIL